MQWDEKELDTQFTPNVYLDTQFCNPGYKVLKDGDVNYRKEYIVYWK